MPGTRPPSTQLSRAVTLNHVQMMRRLYVRCHCDFHSCEQSSASGVIRRFAVPQAGLLERRNQFLRLRRDLLSITRVHLLHILLAIYQPSLGDRARLPSSSLFSSRPCPLLPLSRCHYTRESDLSTILWKHNLTAAALQKADHNARRNV